MRHVLCLGLLLWAAPTFAQPVNTLTPKEIAEGWLLLFDGDTDFGWAGEGSIQAVDGKLEIKGDGLNKALARCRGRFQDFELHFDLLETGERRAYFIVDRGEKAAVTLGALRASKDLWLKAIFNVQGEHITWAVFPPGGKPSETTVASKPVSCNLEWHVPKGSVLYLKNVKLKPLGLKSIFSGKDLSGWKEFSGKKSNFTVTGDGAINIKDGPGDLQTEGKYDDFLLQLECISNGKHLNSGVFFRCRPNEYQNGYEVQIRNQFTPEPTQDYTLEEYDPHTNKLLAKKKAKFTAFDYGTGAIYRRQPARKEVAKDGEWFTLTIVAHKNHLATWVNGIQVADWTDHRPRSDNARNGSRLEAGHISLQGHDPTTDLSFRGFRIAEIK